jgi:hypothetical protein
MSSLISLLSVVGRDTPKDTPARLSTLRVATTTRHALVLDDLAIKVVLGLHNAANEHPATHAGVGPLQAGVVGLYGVVVILGGWVRVVRYSHGVNLLCRLAGLREVRTPRSRFLVNS